MRIDKYIYMLLFGVSAVGLMSCTQDDEEITVAKETVRFDVSLEPFEGETMTRTNEAGTSFEAGDQFRMKIICPHTSTHQSGELWSSGYYTFTIGNETGFSTTIESQATTYVYTAQNTTGTRIFVVRDYRYTRPSNFFCADQSKLEHFKQSDVVWAQAIRQTGAREVYLKFKHKVARLDITIDDSNLKKTTEEGEKAFPLSENAILTLVGMPDIDGAEIVVGDYYADDSYESENYSYRQKASCSYENNGKVLGIEVIDEVNKRSSIASMTGNPTPGGSNSKVYDTVANTATYTCYKTAPRHFLLYVPPCTLTQNAVFWVRDGERRYSAQLVQKTFTEGVCYKVTVVLGTPTIPEGGEGGGFETN